MKIIIIDNTRCVVSILCLTVSFLCSGFSLEAFAQTRVTEEIEDPILLERTPAERIPVERTPAERTPQDESFQEKVRKRSYPGGRDEEPLKVQIEVFKPVRKVIPEMQVFAADEEVDHD